MKLYEDNILSKFIFILHLIITYFIIFGWIFLPFNYIWIIFGVLFIMRLGHAIRSYKNKKYECILSEYENYLFPNLDNFMSRLQFIHFDTTIICITSLIFLIGLYIKILEFI